MKKLFLIYLLATVNIAIAQDHHSHTENCDHSAADLVHEEHKQTEDHQHSANESHDHHSETNEHSSAAHDHSAEHQAPLTEQQTLTITPKTFIQSINTTGIIKTAPSAETVISAPANGIVNFLAADIVIGKEIARNEDIFAIRGQELTHNNPDIQFLTWQNAYHQSRENFRRAQSLVAEKIISQKEYLARKFEYEADSLRFLTLQQNFLTGELRIKAPAAGEIFEIFVQNGDYVTVGQKLATITQSCHNYLEVDLPKKYFPQIQQITAGTFRPEYSEKLYPISSQQKIASSHRLSPGSPYAALTFSLGHNHHFLPGNFVEVWLEFDKSENSIVIPKSALIEEQGLYFVFIKHAEDDYLRTSVKIAAFNAEQAKISSGLHFDDEILVKGVLEMKLSQSSSVVDPHAGHNH